MVLIVVQSTPCQTILEDPHQFRLRSVHVAGVDGLHSSIIFTEMHSWRRLYWIEGHSKNIFVQKKMVPLSFQATEMGLTLKISKNTQMYPKYPKIPKIIQKYPKTPKYPKIPKNIQKYPKYLKISKNTQKFQKYL